MTLPEPNPKKPVRASLFYISNGKIVIHSFYANILPEES
jgi:hypothetical protein